MNKHIAIQKVTLSTREIFDQLDNGKLTKEEVFEMVNTELEKII